MEIVKFLLASLLAVSCTAMSEKSIIRTWESFPISESTDMEQLHTQIAANPAQWKAAAAFLTGNKLSDIQTGRHEITPEGTFANVQEYMTKIEAPFEAHRKYIDVQIVVDGQEYINVASLDAVGPLTQEYSESSDIMFWASANPFRAVCADSGHWVILFPSDAHAPCISRDGNPVQARKIVVKIPYSE